MALDANRNYAFMNLINRMGVSRKWLLRGQNEKERAPHNGEYRSFY